MANVKFVFTVIALVLSYGVTSTEERPLMTQEKAARMEKGSANFHVSRSLLVDMDGESDDFRPTNPGHSPGAGHSTGPSRSNAHYRTDTDGESDDFRPTNPGHSPGAGHSTGPSRSNAH